MNFDWAEYLQLARQLCRDSTSSPVGEACQRTAISRAYYASFCLVRNHARDHEQLALTGLGKDHNKVITHFKYHSEKVGKSIGVNLDRLRVDRNEADYQDLVRGLAGKTLLAILTAESIEGAIAHLQGGIT